MSLLGEAAVAMWWNVAEEHLTEFHEWHSKEHLPERLGIPGFNRGSRWQQEGTGEFFVMYELESYDVLTSPGYLSRLNAPTPWSTAMMPRHLGMIRSQCRIVASHGNGVATYMATLRLSPREGAEAQLADCLTQTLARVAPRAGVIGAHFLQTQTPKAEPTIEQRIRGGDAVANWIVLVSGHNRDALSEAIEAELGREKLSAAGADSVTHAAPYRLVHALVSRDV